MSRAGGTPMAGAVTSITLGKEVVVHAAGAVVAPGVYRLPAGTRVEDLIKAAGGASLDADLDRIDLAALLVDGSQVFVPHVGEAVPAAASGGSSASTPAGPVNLNTATLEQLDALPGVGPATAKAILAERDKRGRFRSVNDLLDVRGIGRPSSTRSATSSRCERAPPALRGTLRPWLRVTTKGRSRRGCSPCGWPGRARRSGEREADVPCDGCTACCTSSQFVHIGPRETDALAHIPRALLFPAPQLPKGNVLMGYDERGHCPMLIDGACSIYEHRPRTCRTYDCRVFPATGLEPDEPAKVLITRRVRRWRFSFPNELDRVEQDEVRAIAARAGDARCQYDATGRGRRDGQRDTRRSYSARASSSMMTSPTRPRSGRRLRLMPDTQNSSPVASSM